jgi:hypothetical protein
MVQYSQFLVMAFYVVIIGLLMGVGSLVARFVVQVSEMVGFIAGGVIGLIVSLSLWNFAVGQGMIRRGGPFLR